MRKLTKVLAGVAVAAIFTIAAAVPAQAADNDFTPSPNKFREYMLNVTSKVLKGAMPNSWQREQLANQYRYNHSWETLDAQFGFDTANPNYLGAPDSYDDYVIKRMEQDKKGGFGGKPLKAPATQPSLWQKGARVGGGLMALTGFPVGTMLGTGLVDILGGFFGYDAEGGVCSQPEGWGKDAQMALTGRDCSMWSGTADYLASLVGLPMKCVKKTATSADAFCVVPVGIVVYKYPGSTGVELQVCIVTDNRPVGDVSGLPPDFSGTWVYEFESDRKVRTGTAFWGSADGNNYHCKPLQAHVTTYANDQASFDDLGAIKDFWPADGSRRIAAAEVEAPGGGEEFQLECEVTLDDGSKLRAKGAAFGKNAETLPPPSCPSVPEGRVATNVDVREQKPTDAPGTGTSVSSQPTTPEYQDWATNYPECGTGACKLDLIQKPKASCFDLEYQCADWFEDSNKENKYQCRYGVKDVDLEECAVYAGLFKPGRVDTGSPYTDPETGVWSGGKNAPEESRNAMGLPVQNPADIRGCDGTSGSGSFDPIRFIMRPIQCALEWAFVPRPAVVEAELSGGGQAWEKKPPKVIADVVSGFSVAPSVSGCSRSTTMFAGSIFQMQVEAWNFCPGTPGAMIATASRVATTAAMVVLVVIVVRRQIAGMVGYGAGQ